MSYDNWLDKKDDPDYSDAAAIIIAEWMLDIERVGDFLINCEEEGIDMAPCVLQAMAGRPNQLKETFSAWAEDKALAQAQRNAERGFEP